MDLCCGLVTPLLLADTEAELRASLLMLFSLSGSGTKFFIHAFLSLWTYLNSSGAGPASCGSVLMASSLTRLTSLLTTAVFTTEVMGVASAASTLLPRVLGSVTRCS